MELTGNVKGEARGSEGETESIKHDAFLLIS